jgi:acetolactate synthase-1/2/3 large subunit
MSAKYSDQFMDWLKNDGYTTCFFVGGGNVMHLLESASRRFKCIPVVHEVAAGIAAEYFNENNKFRERAFALVTAGPGLTNIVTAIGGAFLESRELLVIGGQAKVSDLAHGRVPQIGHQEIDGIGIVNKITVSAIQADRRLTKEEVLTLTARSRTARKGPVFIEMCLDVSAMPVLEDSSGDLLQPTQATNPTIEDIQLIQKLWSEAERPLVLVGGGFDRNDGKELIEKLKGLNTVLATTWNGFDRVESDYIYYGGRPNTYGMRWSNIAIQSADFVLALGTRLGIQQVGFAWEDFVPNGKIVQVDIDKEELNKGFPKIHLGMANDAVSVLSSVLKEWSPSPKSEWLNFILEIRKQFDFPDPANIAKSSYIELHKFIFELGDYLLPSDIIVPCSSGGTFNAVMQMFKQKSGQVITTNKSLASMGYGLAGAIGASISNPGKRVILMEGDGGFAQNLQELGTVSVQKLPIKIFLTSNKGYASIRTTQKSYFNGNYVGCDRETGLGLPNWENIGKAFNISSMVINQNNLWGSEMILNMESNEPFLFIVELDPEQLYFPKVTSRVLADGSMKTNPIHLMSPNLEQSIAENAYRFIPRDKWDF